MGARAARNRRGENHGESDIDPPPLIMAPVDGLLYMSLVSGLIEAQGYGIAVADYRDSKWIE